MLQPSRPTVTLNSIIDAIKELAREHVEAGDMTADEAALIVRCLYDALRGFFPRL